MGNLRSNAVALELASRPVTPARVLRPAVYNNARVTVDASGTVSNIQNGPTATASASSTGGIVQLPGGAMLQWGKSAAAAAGGPSAVVAVVFPTAFVNPPNVVCGPDGPADSTGNFPFTCIPANITNTGFDANFNCEVQLGGGGAAGIFNTVHANWHALGV